MKRSKSRILLAILAIVCEIPGTIYILGWLFFPKVTQVLNPYIFEVFVLALLGGIMTVDIILGQFKKSPT